MRRTWLLIPLLACVWAATSFAAPGDEEDLSKPQPIYLKSGKRIFGRVVEGECSDAKLVLREIRSNVKRELKWSDLKPEQARKLRVALGFEVDERGTGMTVKGIKIVTRSGATFKGLWLNPKSAAQDGYYRLKRHDGERRINAGDVRSGPTEVELDALEVYTPKELYDQRMKERPPETAEDHFQMGDYAAFVGALEQAKMHYEKTLSMGSAKYPEALIKRHLSRVMKRLANAEAEDMLKEIRQATWRKRWKAASELIKQFREKYKDDEDLIKDVDQLEEALRTRRQEHFVVQVPGLIRSAVKKQLGIKVRQAELTIKDAQDYAGGEVVGDQDVDKKKESVSSEAIAIVAEKLGITPAEVLEFWHLRSKRAIQKAFYRSGTFVYMESEGGVPDALAKAPKLKIPKGKNAPKMPRPNRQMTAEPWWEAMRKQRKWGDLADFLYAWWAEKSGMVELEDPKKETCPSCQGRGYTASTVNTSAGALPFYNRCAACYMAKHFRVVRFR